MNAQAQFFAAPPTDDAELVERHADLVRRIAHHMAARLPASIDVTDLIQAGLIGLLEAARNYSGAHGASFETYTHDDWVRMAKRNCRNRHAVRKPEPAGRAEMRITPAIIAAAAVMASPLAVVQTAHAADVNNDTTIYLPAPVARMGLLPLLR